MCYMLLSILILVIRYLIRCFLAYRQNNPRRHSNLKYLCEINFFTMCKTFSSFTLDNLFPVPMKFPPQQFDLVAYQFCPFRNCSYSFWALVFLCLSFLSYVNFVLHLKLYSEVLPCGNDGNTDWILPV